MAKQPILGYGRQDISQGDIEAVAETLRADLLTTGPTVARFEEEFATRVGAEHAIAVANGTAALHLACLAAGFGPGDEVIVSPMTFAADANAVLYCGATPIFADVTDTHGHIDPEAISRAITTKTKGIIPVDYAGFPCAMSAIRKIAERSKLTIIQDGCHALGATYEGSPIGSCAFSDMTIFSFHPVKHMTTGEGGMITTNDAEAAALLQQLRNHGLQQPQDKVAQEGRWYQEVGQLGYNYRLNDIQAALGRSQLQRLDAFVAARRTIATRYDEAFASIPEINPLPPMEGASYHLYIIKVKDGETRRQLFDHLWEHGIRCQVHYVPVHVHAFYAERGWKSGDMPIAEEFYNHILSIPIYPTLGSEQERVIDAIKGFFDE